MAVIVPRVRRISAGFNVWMGVDSGNPLAAGLVSAIVPYGYSAMDLVTGVVATPAGTNQVTRVAPSVRSGRVSAVMAVENPSAAVGALEFAIGGSGMDNISGGPFSIFLEASPQDGIGASSATILSSSEGSLGNGVWIDFDDATGVTNGTRIIVDNGAATRYSNFEAFGTAFEAWSHRFLWTFDGVNSNIYTEGRLNSSQTFLAPSSHANRRTRLFGKYDTTTTRAGFVLALGWNRALSLYEYQQLWLNPWQMFRPTSHVYAFSPAAAASDVFIEGLARVEQGMKAATAAGMGGVLIE